jgi:tetratricopeptide (TPR) repeat protein
MRHEYALSIYNEGRALQDAGNIRAAVSLFAKARAIAEHSDFTDVLRLSLNALGAATFDRGQYAKSRDCGSALIALARKARSEEDELGALHMLAVSELALGNKRDATLRFRQAISRARKRGADEFLSRCLVDSTRSATLGQISNPDRSRLTRIAKREQKRRSPVAGYIWRAIARVADADGDDAVASNAYATAMQCLSSRSPSTRRLKADFAGERFTWAWHHHRYDEALRVLKDLERRDTRLRSRDAIAARDQRGVCLQEMGRHNDAEPLHRSAARSAQREGDVEQEERSLNNLGEALRAQGRYREAIQAFRRSEAIARKGHRYEAVISTAHNRALALEQQGNLRGALRVLRQCRDEARRRRLWHEYVRSLEGLAKLAWLDGDRVKSLRLYERAMGEAQRHGFDELQPRIALNIARGSLAANRPKHGLAVLSRFRDTFSRFIDAHHYLGTLAELQNAVGQASKALDTWRASKQHAQALGDVEHVRYCEPHEASTQAAVETARRTEKSLRAAIAVEQASDRRAVLLIQLVELLLRRKKTEAAQTAFEEALRFCTESHLDARKCELYMTVADNELSGSRSDQLNALKAYVMAMISVIESEPDSLAKLASRITFKLASADSPISAERLRSLVVDLRSALATEVPSTPADAMRFLFWPFDLAARLVPYRNWPEMMQEAVARLASAENVRRYLSTGRLTA